MVEFKKQVLIEFGYIVKIRTVHFTDLARSSATFARVTGNTRELNLNDILMARAMARQYNIILDFPNIIIQN